MRIMIYAVLSLLVAAAAQGMPPVTTQDLMHRQWFVEPTSQNIQLIVSRRAWVDCNPQNLEVVLLPFGETNKQTFVATVSNPGLRAVGCSAPQSLGEIRGEVSLAGLDLSKGVSILLPEQYGLVVAEE